MNANFEKREYIQARMLKEAARIWSDGELLDPESYDPVVGLLVGACASELERVGHEIQAVQNRVFERMVQLLLPGTLTGPLPAHAIVQARPTEPGYVLQPQEQFLIRRLVGDVSKELYFSTPQPLRLFDAAIVFMAAGRVIYRVREDGWKEPFAEAPVSHSLPGGSIWLALETNDLIESPQGFHFYFDWRQDAHKQDYLRLLPLLRWYVDGVEWQADGGLPNLQEAVPRDAASDLRQEFSVLRPIEAQVEQLYRQQFFTLKKNKKAFGEEVTSTRRQWPEAFEPVFHSEVLESLQTSKRAFFWINIQFPQAFPPNAVETMLCTTNSFPVLNRRLHTALYSQVSRAFSLVPLQSDDPFLSVAQVRTAGGELLEPAPFADMHQGEAGTWTLRNSGVARFDARSASEMLQYLHELMREESAAFAAYDRDLLAGDIKELNQKIAVLEKKLSAGNAEANDSTPYLLLRLRKLGEDVNAEFWSTAGALANRLPTCSKLETYGASGLRRDSVFTLTATTGGRDSLGTSAKQRLFKEAVLTRGRVVTSEDIRALCFARAGELVQQVEVRKGVRLSEELGCGLLHVIEVALTPLDSYSSAREDWGEVCRSLRLELEARAGGLHRFEVMVKKGG